MKKSFHALSVKESFKELKTSLAGLSNDEVSRRVIKYGLNKLKVSKQISPWKIFLSQFQGFLVYLLFGAAVLSFLVKEYIDAGAILTILILNGILGFIQEFKAEKAIEALKKLETPHAKVTRDGRDTSITAEELVPGDILILSEGDKIPADARIIEAHFLQVDESILTGESRPQTKSEITLKKDLAIHDRKNCIFSGTIVTKGRARAVVFATGMETQIGQIATLVDQAETSETPLQKTLEYLGKMLGLISMGVAIPGLILGFLKGREFVEIVMTAIALAVSAIPEGLPVVVTISLALGARRMVKRGILIRKLPAVEALGSTDVICSDKTGTITINKMTVTEIFTPHIGHLNIHGEEMKAKFYQNDSDKIISDLELSKDKAIATLAYSSLLNNDSDLEFGDPTEQALLVFAEQLGISTEEGKQKFPRLNEIPFDSANKYMITLNKTNGHSISNIKGAPETILSACSHYMTDNGNAKITPQFLQKINKINEAMSTKALRVLAVAIKENADNKNFAEMKNFTFVGLVGMIDPPRPQVKEALQICKQAGIRVLMITGDHPLTAGAVAKEIGLHFNKVMTGVEMDKLSKKELAKIVAKENVFARVSPAHKLEILRILQKQKHLVAMTGDGVNDAPALKEADIGIGMGGGSDLAKEISDMIILDNNFATIAKAIAEGRGIFFNIKKFIKFLVGANFDEIFVILTTIILGIPLPFLPIHILWLNLITDSLPALALSVDSYDSDLMQKKPYDPKKKIVKGVLVFSVFAGLIAYVASLGIFLLEYKVFGVPLLQAQTMAFTVTVLFELLFVFTVRSNRSAFKAGLFSNKLLLFAVIFGFFLQLFAIYFPYTHDVFKTVPILINEWPKILLFASLGFLVIEILRALRLNFFDEKD